MQKVSERTLRIMDKIEYSRWEKAYEKYPTLSEIILLHDNPKTIEEELEAILKELIASIESGLSLNVIKKISDPKFYSDQMYEIRTGFEEGLTWGDVKKYAKPKFTDLQMKEIRVAIRQGLSDEQLKVLLDPSFNHMQMQQIIKGFLIEGLSIEAVKVFAVPKYTVRIMSLFREAIAGRVDIDKLAIIKSCDYSLNEVEQCIDLISKYPDITINYWRIICKTSPYYSTTKLIIEEANKGLSLELVDVLVKSNYNIDALKMILEAYKKFTPTQADLLLRLNSDYKIVNIFWIEEVIRAFNDGFDSEVIKSCLDASKSLEDLKSSIDEERRKVRIQKLNQLVNKKTE